MITLAAGLGLKRLETDTQLYTREAYLMIALSWLCGAGRGAFVLAGTGLLAAPSNAFFESISGITTTGATIMIVGASVLITLLLLVDTDVATGGLKQTVRRRRFVISPRPSGLPARLTATAHFDRHEGGNDAPEVRWPDQDHHGGGVFHPVVLAVLTERLSRPPLNREAGDEGATARPTAHDTSPGL